MKNLYNLIFKSICILLIIMLFTFCTNTSKLEKNNSDKMTENDKNALGALGQIGSDWENLSDGKSFNGWHIFKKNGINDSWIIEDGAFVYVGGTDGNSTGNDLISDKKFTSYVLSVDWKVSKGANSGIFYGINENSDFGQPYFTAPEIQVVDNNNSVGSSKEYAGSLYDLVPAKEGLINSVGKWNNYIIEINHYTNQAIVNINGTEALSYPLSGNEWNKMIKNSKFRDWSEFGKHKTGNIGLQDHGGKVSYKNIKIKEIK
jgi:hypothetical protein